MEYRNMGNHAHDLADGRMVAPGEYVELSDEQLKDPHNADLVETGILMSISEEDKGSSSKTTSKSKARGEGVAEDGA